MNINKSVKEILEEKYGDLTSLVDFINSDEVDSILLPAGMTVLEFWELCNEQKEC